MRKRDRFSVRLTWQLEDGVEVDMKVTGRWIPYDPGITSLPPEHCRPPEGGYAEDVICYNQRGTRMPADLVERICEDDKFHHAVELELKDQRDQEAAAHV